ncbi:MAG: methylmalonyl-CoA mutase family protein [Bacteroidota bacterium]
MHDEKVNSLFGQFSPVTLEEWKAKIIADLKGADYEKKLVWPTGEGFGVDPVYHTENLAGLDHLAASPGRFPYVRGNKTRSNDWDIRQNISYNNDPKEANRRILDALERGATSIGIIFAQGTSVEKDDFYRLLQDVYVQCVPLHFFGYHPHKELYTWLKSLSALQGVKPDELSGSLGVRPLGELTERGLLSEDLDMALDKLAASLKEVAAGSPGLKVIDIYAAIFQNAGSSLTQELAFALAMANEYIARMEERGIKPEVTVRNIAFNFATGPNFFLEIARLRAARLLWATVCKAWGLPEEQSGMFIHSTGATWNKTLYDPYVNMLRATTETMSAALGGADAISTVSFDQPYGQPGDLGSRVARNTQIILKEEAFFDKVIDPAAGSYFIESITDAIAGKAWELFREVEARGGYLEALKREFIQEEIEKSLARKKERIASRRDTLVGTNQYPDFREMIISKFTPQLAPDLPANPMIRPLKRFRAAAGFEELRLKTEKSGKRPKVLLFKYGNPVWMTARAQFAGNFFACAGFEIIDPPGFKSLEEGFDYTRKVMADIVVICSSDEEYPEIVPPVHDDLSDYSILVVAGNPAESIEQLKAIGIRYFIHMKSDILTELALFQKLNGI